MTIETGYSLAELHATGSLCDIGAEQVAWLPSLPASASDDEIRAELATKGVVHVKGVMPREFVLATRRKYFEHMGKTGMLKEGSDPEEGIWVGGDADGNDWVAPASASLVELSAKAEENLKMAWEVPHLPWSSEFCRNEYLRDMVMRLKPAWHDPFIFKRQIWRTNIPNAPAQSIGVHYDYTFLRAAPPETSITAWVPVGDCTPLMGGLIYLEDSVGMAAGIEDDFTRQGEAKNFTRADKIYAFNSNMDATGLLSRSPGQFALDHAGADGTTHRWLIGNYEAGDVVFHNSLMIHAASGNLDPHDRIRLSCDLRFGDRAADYDYRWDAGVHVPNDGL